MENWSIHHLFDSIEGIFEPEKISDICKYARNLKNKGLPVIFSLGHLSKILGVSYIFLRNSIMEGNTYHVYKQFRIKKNSGGGRLIHSPMSPLIEVQRFINKEILQQCEIHPCAYAFRKGKKIRQCAEQHCGAKYLFRYDIKDFFHQITEKQVYKVFRGLGYKKLLSFELARLCTVNIGDTTLSLATEYEDAPYHYKTEQARVLPQGAPTSPMLSNLAIKDLDAELFEFALNHNLVFTRYADDIVFSMTKLPVGFTKSSLNYEIKKIIRKHKFQLNEKKSHISGLGSRKVVLGLLVDGPKPRVLREVYKTIDNYLFIAKKCNNLRDAANFFQFRSPRGFREHVIGLLGYIRDVEKERGMKLLEIFEHIPFFQPESLS